VLIVVALAALAAVLLVDRPRVPARTEANRGPGWVSPWTARRQRAACRAALPSVVRTIAAELSAGAVPAAALDGGAEVAPEPVRTWLHRCAAEVRLGADAGVLLARPPAGGEQLAVLAACWSVSGETGAGLAAVCAQVARALADERRAADETAAALAGPRASASVLAGLPLVGLLLAAGLGANPWAFARTPLGAACFAGAAGLDALGLVWTRALARRAAR
jgi:tight adherence protein B